TLIRTARPTLMREGSRASPFHCMEDCSNAMRAPTSYPLHRQPIQLERPVSGQDREALVQRLHDEHPVERIVVVQREIAQEITMSQADCQRDELISRDDALYE